MLWTSLCQYPELLGQNDVEYSRFVCNYSSPGYQIYFLTTPGAHPTTSPPSSETPNGICHVCLSGETHYVHIMCMESCGVTTGASRFSRNLVHTRSECVGGARRSDDALSTVSDALLGGATIGSPSPSSYRTGFAVSESWVVFTFVYLHAERPEPWHGVSGCPLPSRSPPTQASCSRAAATHRTSLAASPRTGLPGECQQALLHAAPLPTAFLKQSRRSRPHREARPGRPFPPRTQRQHDHHRSRDPVGRAVGMGSRGFGIRHFWLH